MQINVFIQHVVSIRFYHICLLKIQRIDIYLSYSSNVLFDPSYYISYIMFDILELRSC